MKKSILVKGVIKGGSNKKIGGSKINMELHLRKAWEILII